MGGAVFLALHGSGGFIVPEAKGAVWMGQGAYYDDNVGMMGRYRRGNTLYSSHMPGTYPGHKYLSFEFTDTSHGDTLCFGWVEIFLSNDRGSTGPNVTIYSYAYDDTGAYIATGATPVPEPSSIAMLVLGALVLGARGLRSWRCKGATNSK